MLWIVEDSLVKTPAERKVRLSFIKELSGDKGVSWQKLSCDFLAINYYYCRTDDGINGVFATMHMYLPIMFWLFGMLKPSTKDMFVINTCMIDEGRDKTLLSYLKEWNSEIQLYFAKQEYDVEFDCYTNIISDVGEFGFMTSKSEKIMFLNKDKGILEAISKGFDVVELKVEEEGEYG